MGQAKQRQDAIARGEPWLEDRHRCPACGSRRTVVERAAPMGLSHVPTLMGACADCRTIWEALPADWTSDAVEASPCDNCAFAPGSPELQDRDGWRGLLASLRAGREFKCHKGAPIHVDQAAGTVEFDAAWIQAHGRSCAGFVRVMQKWPDWLENRYPGAVHVLTTRDADLLEGIEPVGCALEDAL